MDKLIGIILVILIVVAAEAISFGVIALMFFGICWAFGLTFSWKIAVGVWLIISLLVHIFRGGGSK